MRPGRHGARQRTAPEECAATPDASNGRARWPTVPDSAHPCTSYSSYCTHTAACVMPTLCWHTVTWHSPAVTKQTSGSRTRLPQHLRHVQHRLRDGQLVDGPRAVLRHSGVMSGVTRMALCKCQRLIQPSHEHAAALHFTRMHQHSAKTLHKGSAPGRPRARAFSFRSRSSSANLHQAAQVSGAHSRNFWYSLRTRSIAPSCSSSSMYALNSLACAARAQGLP